MSQNQWHKELALFCKWAIDVGAFEYDEKGVDTRIRRFEAAERRRGSVLPKEMPLPEENLQRLQTLRNNLEDLQGLVAGNPSDSGAHDFDGSDRSGSTKGDIIDYYDRVQSTIDSLNILCVLFLMV